MQGPFPVAARVGFRGYLSFVLLVGAVACGSQGHRTSNEQEYAEAGIITGIAATAAIIQAARGRAEPVRSADECCAVCDRCSFPCGDGCLGIGNVCMKPKGCACYDTQLPIGHRPARSDLPCLNEPTEGGPDGVVIPLGIEY
jgi:hypothetical protein